MEPEPSKWASRKFVLTVLQWLVVIGLPLAYKSFEISEAVLMTVLASSTSIIAVYTGMNVLQKKIDAD